MPRPSILLNIVLFVAVLVLSGILQRQGDRTGDDHAIASSHADQTSAFDTIPVASDQDALARATLAQLQRIDARLAALEARGGALPPAAQAPVRIDPRMAAEAERRVALFFSDREVDREAWARWQATLSDMPPAERLALGAAFAREVNRDRLALRF